MRERRYVRTLAWVVGVMAMGALCVGCPFQPWQAKGEVTVLFSADAAPLVKAVAGVAAAKAEVPIEDIESLTVTITKIVLDRAGVAEDDEEDAEENGEENGGKNGDEAPSKVVVFSGELEVNLLDLVGVSEVLSTAEVPAGKYTKIRLEISNPRLVLASDPETEITDIQLTANGRLFVSQQFEIPAGESVLLLLDFGGIHLVPLGNGGYVLTPQLQVTIEITSADVTATGVISALDTDNDTLTLELEDGSIEVDYSGAEIFLPPDTDTPTGQESDLAVGLTVQVQGTATVNGPVSASSIHILAEED